MAILDAGRIVRQSPTEVLREQVKQVCLSAEAIRTISPPKGLLDVRRHADRFVITVDEAPLFLKQLESHRTPHEVTDLNLDDIFESFVIGRPDDWPEANPALATV